MDDYMKGYDRLIESKKIVDQMEAEKLEVLILRKQAEAVESMCGQWKSEAKDLPLQHEHRGRGSSTYNWQMHYANIGQSYAQRLRQQADELEQ